MAQAENDVDTAVQEALERDFQQVLQEMSGDQSIEKFRKEFQKLYDRLKKSHENEKFLQGKAKELGNSISRGTGMIKTAMQLATNDQTTKNVLKNELDEGKTLLNHYKEKIERGKARMDNYGAMIKNQEDQLKVSESFQSGRANEINSQMNAKKDLMSSRDSLQNNCSTMTSDISNMREDMKAIENAKIILQTDVKSFKKTLAETDERIRKDEERNAKHQRELEKLIAEIEQINKEKTQEQKEINDIGGKLEDRKGKTGKLEGDKGGQDKQINLKVTINAGIKNQIDEKKNEKQVKSAQRDKLDMDIKNQNGSQNEGQIKLNQLSRNRDKKNDEIQRVNYEREEAIKMQVVYKNQVYELQREVEVAKKTAQEDKNHIIELLKDQNNIKVNFTKIVQKNQFQQAALLKVRDDCAKLDKEALAQNKLIGVYQRDANVLNLEKEKRGKEALQAMQKYYHLTEEIKLKDNLISEFQKKTLEAEAKQKQQQQLYEAVRSDRNLYSKNLTETQDEIAEIKRRYKIVMHQIAQLKEEIEAKDRALSKEYNNATDFQKQHQSLERVNDTYKKNIEQKTQDIKNFKNEIGKLQFIIKESEQKRLKLKEQYENVVSARDILGTQLIRRNDEQALIYEKIKMQQNTLAKGESEYRERESDIGIQRNTINDLTRELKIFKKKANTITDLTSNIDNLNKELIEEKQKVKALSEELENPMNVHRWRKLEGTDCDAYEMISKIQILQKRLIAKTEEVVSKDLVINTQEQTINNLREVMKRQPGLAEAEMISHYQGLIKGKTRKLKAQAAELNMYQAQSNEYKYEIERLGGDLKEMKREYYEIKRREQLIKDQRAKEEADRGGQNQHLV